MTADDGYGIVVYGATMPGIAAIRTATTVDSGVSILLVNPRRGWGGVGGAGGQNFWDRRFWNHEGTRRLPQGGSFRHWYDDLGQAYDTEEMQRRLRSETEDVTVLDQWEVTDVAVDGERLDRLELTPLSGPSDEELDLGGRRKSVTGDVFVDASETGRLTRLAGVPYSVGREDWADDDRQMAATLMFRVADLDWDRIRNARHDGRSVFETYTDPTTGKRLFWGGDPIIDIDPRLEAFAEAYPRFDIKPMNAAEHRDGEFWVNALLVYDVDGTIESYDERRAVGGDERTPWSRLEAYDNATTVLESSLFERTMRSFPGFDDATLPEPDAEDRVATLLYLRETIHGGELPHTVTRADVEDAGIDPSTGTDARHHDARIGLAFYWLDNNSYAAHEHDPELGDAANPMYVPYDSLTMPNRSNLLVPGYAANVSGQAWFSLRVLPNLCVLGDAAGVAAALAVDRGVAPTADEPFVRQVQRELRRQDVVLDKTDAPELEGTRSDD